MTLHVSYSNSLMTDLSTVPRSLMIQIRVPKRSFGLLLFKREFACKIEGMTVDLLNMGSSSLKAM